MTCYRCRQHTREPNGYCRACNNARLRDLYRREVNATPRRYRLKRAALDQAIAVLEGVAA